MRMGSRACRAEHQTTGSIGQGETQERRGGLLGTWATNSPSFPGAQWGPVLLEHV